MPKRSYGSTSKKRTLQLLEIILKISKKDWLSPADRPIDFRWLNDGDVKYPSLVVKATVADLWAACNSNVLHPSLTKSAVRESLHALKDFLGILEDNRVRAQGAIVWHFTLKLWSKDVQKNLKAANQLWEMKRFQRKRQSIDLTSSGGTCSSSTSSDLQELPKTETAPISLDFLGNYARQYQKQYGYLKILPGVMSRPVLLESIYIAVKVLDEQSRRFLSAQTIEETYHKFQSRSFLSHELTRRDGEQVGVEYPYLMVLGGPGMGKSTFLKKLGLKALKVRKQSQYGFLPIYLEIKTLIGGKIDLEKAIKTELTSLASVHPADLELDLTQESCLFLFDGLDEISGEELNEVVKQIQNLLKKNYKSRFVISCRTAAHTFNFNNFIDVIVAEFDDAQIKEFIQRWFGEDVNQVGGNAHNFWQCLCGYANAAIKELARTPLLLTYLCLIYKQDKTLPTTRGHLYTRILDIFLVSWDQQRNIPEPGHNFNEGFTPYLQKQVLAEVAYENFRRDRLFFSSDSLLEKLANFLSKSPNSLSPDAAFQYMLTRQGILVERFANTLCFSHLTLQEYLTAYWLIKRQEPSDFFDSYIIDPRWREVILLTVELLENDALPLLQNINKRIQTNLAKYPKLREVILWSSDFLDEAATSYHECANLLSIFIALASSRGSSFDLDTEAGAQVASTLAKACERAVTIAQFASTTYQASIICAVAIASARAIAGDEAKAIAVDRVIKGASDLINNASNDAGIIDETQRIIVLRKAMQFAQNAIMHHQTTTLQILDTRKVRKDIDSMIKCIPHAGAPSFAWSKWADQLEERWFNTLSVSKAFATFSIEEAEALQQYLYLTELLARCLELPQTPSFECYQKLQISLLRC